MVTWRAFGSRVSSQMSDRLVRVLSDPARDGEESCRFSEFSASPNIVLLGDPGAGKTHLFRHFADHEGGTTLPAREFLVHDEASLRGGGPIFIDALDERRAGRGDQNTIDSIVAKLVATKPSRVRIACRSVDWLGETDLAVFKVYFDRTGGYVVLGLMPLTDDERLVILRAQGISEPLAFIEQARFRGLEDMIANPQNVIMLAKVVRQGGWPHTRSDLFSMATNVLLAEHNAARSRAGAGIHTPAELFEAAGAICAARLIGDVDGIGLAESSVSADFPSYRSLATLHSLEKVHAALGRRAFIGGRLAETVDYAHRTIAEYIAASWLACQVRQGLPIGRLCALMGIDGRPASELRGLHAWLAVCLPEHAVRLIDADPYGVLSYGDAAALSTHHRVRLLEALGRLAAVDPWFRTDYQSSSNYGALSGPDMTDGFGRVLRNTNAGFALRSIVLDALETGTPIPALQQDLLNILMTESAPYAERSSAVACLVRLGASVQEAIDKAYREHLGEGPSDIRLRAEILRIDSTARFGAADVVELMARAIRCPEELMVGTFWTLPQHIPDSLIATILNGIEQVAGPPSYRTTTRNANEVRHVFDGLLLRYLKTNQPLSADVLWKWLKVRLILGENYYADRRADEITTELGRRGEMMREVIVVAVDSFESYEYPWGFVDHLQKVTVHTINPDDVLEELVRYLGNFVGSGKTRQALFELALSLSFRPTPRSIVAFTELYTFAEGNADLRTLRDLLCQTPIDDWRNKERDRRATHATEQMEGRAANIKLFAESRDRIQSGQHVGWLIWIASVYLDLFNGMDAQATPEERLVDELGSKENAHDAMMALIAGLGRQNLPTLKSIVETTAENKHNRSWYALIAGVTEYARQGLALTALPDDLLRAALAIDSSLPTFKREENVSTQIDHTWKTEILSTRPVLAEDAYLALARAGLAIQNHHPQGLYQLMNMDCFGSRKGEIAFQLLRDFPGAPTPALEPMLTVAVRSIERTRLLEVVRRALEGKANVDAWGHWLGAAYLLAPDEFHQKVTAYAGEHPGMVWVFRNFCGGGRRRPPQDVPNLSQLEFITRLIAGRYKHCAHPTGVSSGDTNPWDASEFVQSLIDRISSDPSPVATATLRRMRDDPAMESYVAFVKHALAAQQVRSMDASYKQPGWDEAIVALANGTPANVSDLHAFLVAHLNDLKTYITGDNTDIFKRFWNEDGYGNVKNPKSEPSCGNVLIELLRNRLQKLKIRIEPEGHMANDGRADIVVMLSGQKVVIELKRDYHPDVWVAAGTQLERYARDPEAQGFGIYVVFWYGPGLWPAMPAPPVNAGAKPKCPSEMESMLTTVIPAEKRSKIAVVVIDVTGVPT